MMSQPAIAIRPVPEDIGHRDCCDVRQRTLCKGRQNTAGLCLFTKTKYRGLPMTAMLVLGGVRIGVTSERLIEIDEWLRAYIDAEINRPDVEIFFSWDWSEATAPKTKYIGEDVFHYYYEEPAYDFCETKGGYKGIIARTISDKNYTKLRCYINEKPFIMTPPNLGGLLRFIPLSTPLLCRGVLTMHAAQVIYKGRGILFSGPSGGGKSTQAALWTAYAGAQLVCADRTLLCRLTDGWESRGFPYDGSDAVRSTESFRPCCLVFVVKSMTGSPSVRRLIGKEALMRLYEQQLCEVAGIRMEQHIWDMLFAVAESLPIYLLQTTREEESVSCLKNRLWEEGVLENE